MTYVEGRFASHRAKTRALAVLSLTLGATFAVGVVRNLFIASPEVSAPAQAAAASDIPEATAYAGPLTDAVAPEVRTATRARRVTPSDAVQAPVLQADAAPAAQTIAEDAAAVAPVIPDEPLAPPPALPPSPAPRKGR
jgi:hypothetical protein